MARKSTPYRPTPISAIKPPRVAGGPFTIRTDYGPVPVNPETIQFNVRDASLMEEIADATVQFLRRYEESLIRFCAACATLPGKSWANVGARYADKGYLPPAANLAAVDQDLRMAYEEPVHTFIENLLRQTPEENYDRALEYFMDGLRSDPRGLIPEFAEVMERMGDENRVTRAIRNTFGSSHRQELGPLFKGDLATVAITPLIRHLVVLNYVVDAGRRIRDQADLNRELIEGGLVDLRELGRNVRRGQSAYEETWGLAEEAEKLYEEIARSKLPSAGDIVAGRMGDYTSERVELPNDLTEEAERTFDRYVTTSLDLSDAALELISRISAYRVLRNGIDGTRERTETYDERLSSLDIIFERGMVATEAVAGAISDTIGLANRALLYSLAYSSGSLAVTATRGGGDHMLLDLHEAAGDFETQVEGLLPKASEQIAEHLVATQNEITGKMQVASLKDGSEEN